MKNRSVKISYSIFKILNIVFCFVVFSLDASAIGDHLIFPIPQTLQVTSGEFVLDESVSVVIPENATEKDIFLAHFLVNDVCDKYGLVLKTKRSFDIPEEGKAILIGNINNPLIRGLAEKMDLNINSKDPGPEGYVMEVNDHLIVIAGYDDSGAFYGLQSLRQLVRHGNGKIVQCMKVRDWPNLPMRAIRLYVPGPENQSFFRRFLKDFMALYKYNQIIIEFNCMRLDNHPEINAGWIEFGKNLQYSRQDRPIGKRGEEKDSSHHDAGDGHIIEKRDVREMIEFANENFIEVIPEIPSLSHAYYLLSQHPELAEYREDNWPDTYCPSNPDSYKLLFDVYDEYIDVIKPRIVQIGHDEWRVPMDVCPRCKGKDFSELYVQDVNNIYNYLSNRGIKVAIWGDHLLESVSKSGPRNAISSTGIKYQKPGAIRPSQVKESIPKDILVFNWFWGDQKREQELQNYGFKQFFGNLEPNISNWDERLKKINALGGAPSSWAATNEFNFGKDLLFDFLGCANLLWSKHTLSKTELSDIVEELIPCIRKSLNPNLIPSEDGDIVEYIDISPNENLAKYIASSKLIKQDEVSVENKKFKIVNTRSNSKESNFSVRVFSGSEKLISKEATSILVNEDVSSLLFLHACTRQADNKKAYFNIANFFDTSDLLGWYEIVYEDGFKINVPIQYGVNILEWSNAKKDNFNKLEGETGSQQNVYCYQADPVQFSLSKKENPITFYAFEWVNPRFGKVIKEVKLFGSVKSQVSSTPVDINRKHFKNNEIILVAMSKVKKRNMN